MDVPRSRTCSRTRLRARSTGWGHGRSSCSSASFGGGQPAPGWTAESGAVRAAIAEALGAAIAFVVFRHRPLSDPPFVKRPRGAQVANRPALTAANINLGPLAAQERTTAHIAAGVIVLGPYRSGNHGWESTNCLQTPRERR